MGGDVWVGTGQGQFYHLRELRFDYAALSLTALEKVRYRYRLHGFDKDRVDAGTRRSAFYTALPPGSCRFHVRARATNERA